MASLLPYFLTKMYTIFTTINIMPKLHIFESINFQAKWQAYSFTFSPKFTLFSPPSISCQNCIFSNQLIFKQNGKPIALLFDQNLHYFHHHQYHAKTAHFRINKFSSKMASL